MKIILTIVCMTLLAAAARAELAPSHHAALEKLVKAAGVQKNMEALLVSGFESSLGDKAEQMKSLPPADRQKILRAMATAKALIMEALSTDPYKTALIELYGRYFSEQEAADVGVMMASPEGQAMLSKQRFEEQDIIFLQNSPAARTWVEKQPALLKELVQMTEQHMKTVMPRVKEVLHQELSK